MMTRWGGVSAIGLIHVQASHGSDQIAAIQIESSCSRGNIASLLVQLLFDKLPLEVINVFTIIRPPFVSGSAQRSDHGNGDAIDRR